MTHKLQATVWDLEGPEAPSSLWSLSNDIFLEWVPGSGLCWQVVTWSSQQQVAPEDKHKLQPREWLNNLPKKPDKGEQRNGMRDVTKSWDKINSSRKGAGDSKSSCLWCQLYRFLVRGQAREMIKCGCSISCYLALCQMPCAEPTLGASQ